MTPDWQLIINGQDVSDRFENRLISISLRDSRGFEADQVDIVVDDSDDTLQLPNVDATLQLKIGWAGIGRANKNQNLVDKGEFKITEIEHTGAPDTITIRALSADIKSGLLSQKTKAWHDTTLGAIISSIADKHGLKTAIGPQLSTRVIKHLDQTDESDAHLLTRLGVDHDAIATVKNGYLVFIRQSESHTASGTALKPVEISRADGDQHSYRESSKKDQYSGVTARWLDVNTAKVTDEIIGEAGNTKVLRKTYPDQAGAKAAAEAEWRRIGRAEASMSYTLAVGQAELIPETPISLEGFKKTITDKNWVLAEVSHQISGSGFTSGLVMEISK
ncbi:MAG: contractile injection system protein, VgrG/Pvc8 family [Candidatus Pacearchaeota archaeon]|nr:contractile injection system protein, VgrG/Pvc8 family [Candidatus Pacearchaeota archaeon]